MNLAARAFATEGTLEKYRNKAFDWAGANCIRLARQQGHALGHELPPVPLFRTPLGAMKAIKKQGVDSVEGLLDKYFERLPSPAFVIVGDLVTLPGDEDHGLDAVCIADGRGNLFGWHADTNFEKLEVIKLAQADVKGAWRL